ncbi:N-acetylmannosamine-6-phosphate 2-epimerase [Paenibacillus sp. MY03]|uniref:N-acetylmannosamine-6-phosphate 2-epimerase n=1 Tax=Paenibacillus sp. MY03 TaxID=302980 RepID=UPI000B3CF72F|nr:N-acetylmannosamine-6-phosphate 2-epimerase [Paenibacillus sp. MY03]OUS68936.1 N-acetylmannosamine-6-phosphate 2-epimerase [Paenibacillus sp. MY03]
MLEQIKGGLVVSCQALPHEPLHSPFIMGKLAFAAAQGGALGIRANTKADIAAIKQEVSLPVIGIVKRDYPGSDVFITATVKELDELLESGCEMIAMDATERGRPGDLKLSQLVAYCREMNPYVQLMADISTVEEAMNAERLGFDCVSTTLYGYTSDTAGGKLYDEDFVFLKSVADAVGIPVIAEGNVLTPEMYKRCLAVGAASVVVGGAITRPLEITRRFVEAGTSKQATAKAYETYFQEPMNRHQ